MFRENMTYTFTEEQLNALIYEVMQLAQEGAAFECWEAKDRDWDTEIETEEGTKYFEGNVRLLTDETNSWKEGEKPIYIDCDTGEEVEEITDTWYFYPMEGDPFDIEDLDSIKQLKQ